MKFSVKDFFIFSKCDQIRSFWIWSHLPEKLLMENLIFLYSARHRSEINTFIESIRLTFFSQKYFSKN